MFASLNRLPSEAIHRLIKCYYKFCEFGAIFLGGNCFWHHFNNVTLRLNFCYLKIIHILYSKIIGRILKNKQKNKFVFAHEITRLIIMKMKMKMKNRPHRYDINRPRSRHGHKYSKVSQY